MLKQAKNEIRGETGDRYHQFHHIHRVHRVTHFSGIDKSPEQMSFESNNSDNSSSGNFIKRK